MAGTFEYEVLRFQVGWKGFDYTKVRDELNELGRQGWRVAGTHDPSIAATMPSEMVVILERSTS